MDRRTLLALVLCIGIYYAWIAVRGPQLTAEADTVEVANDEPVAKEAPEPAAPDRVPAPARVVPDQELELALCDLTAKMHSDGRGLHELYLNGHDAPYNVQPLYRYVFGLVKGTNEGPWRPWGEPPGPAPVLSEQAQALSVGAGPWGLGPATMEVVSASSNEVVLKGVTSSGLEVRQTLSGSGDPCGLDVEVSWRNTTSAPVAQDLWVGVHDRIASVGGMSSRYSSHSQPLVFIDGDLAYGTTAGGKVGGCMGVGGKKPEAEGEPVALSGPVSWFGIADRYHGFLVVPQGAQEAHFSVIGEGEQALAGSHVSWAPTLAPGDTHTEQLRVYVGPLKQDVMATFQEDMPEVIDLGFFAFFGYPLLWLLKFFHGLLNNWGLSIIALTLSVKALFFPMTQSSFRSMQKMQAIQPELTRIKEEYADDQQELNRRTMELMADNQVNPIAGCLPMIVQMPIWFAFYQVLLTSVDLYHTEFLYLRDLSAPDPYGALPLAVMALMAIQQKFSNTANMDPAQARVLKLMPLVFGAMFFTFPSGLAVYVFVNMMLSNLQQWWIKRTLGTEGPTVSDPSLGGVE